MMFYEEKMTNGPSKAASARLQSYVNNGIFKTTNNETIYSHWLESTYMVLDDGELKIKFLQSDLVDREIK